jgi:hypothetical protein
VFDIGFFARPKNQGCQIAFKNWKNVPKGNNTTNQMAIKI